MKLETLAKRLAKGTNCPPLEQVILGRGSIHDLSLTECMPWTGRKNAAWSGIRKARDRQNMAYPTLVHARAIGIIQHYGTRHPVHRLIFSIITKPTYKFRMTRHCPTDLCVNPFHWGVDEVKGSSPPRPTTTTTIDDVDAIPAEEPWKLDDAVGLVETYLTTYCPRVWNDLITSNLLMDVPQDLLREALIKLRREHLIDKP